MRDYAEEIRTAIAAANARAISAELRLSHSAAQREKALAELYSATCVVQNLIAEARHDGWHLVAKREEP